VTEDQAAPAADQGSRNLMLRVIAALVLAPVAVAIAWLGGWPWTTLVTFAAIGLYVEWLMIVGMARETRVGLDQRAGVDLGGGQHPLLRAHSQAIERQSERRIAAGRPQQRAHRLAMRRQHFEPPHQHVEQPLARRFLGHVA